MTQTFFRFHRTDAPEFSAANAWSGLWGSEFSEDGSATRCHNCDNGQTFVFGEKCDLCEGTGWEDCAEGYSCCDTAEELIAYFAAHLGSDPGDGAVIVFEGHQVGTGFDGEPLAVPARVVETLTWAEFIAKESN